MLRRSTKVEPLEQGLNMPEENENKKTKKKKKKNDDYNDCDCDDYEIKCFS